MKGYIIKSIVLETFLKYMTFLVNFDMIEWVSTMFSG